MKKDEFTLKDIKDNNITLENDDRSPSRKFFDRNNKYIIIILLILALLLLFLGTRLASSWFGLSGNTGKYLPADIVYNSGNGKINLNTPITNAEIKARLYKKYGNLALRDGIIFEMKRLKNKKVDVIYFSDNSAMVTKNKTITRVSELNGKYGVDDKGNILKNAKTLKVEVKESKKIAIGTVDYYTDGKAIITSNGKRALVRDSSNLIISDKGYIRIAPSGVAYKIKTDENLTYYSDGTIRATISGKDYIVRDSKDISISSNAGTTASTTKAATNSQVPSIVPNASNEKTKPNSVSNKNITFPNNNAATVLNTKNLSDGTTITYFDDGSALIKITHGEELVVRRSGDINLKATNYIIEIALNKNFSVIDEKKLSDGTIIRVYDNGKAIVTYPNGKVDIVKDATNIHYNTDGSISKIVSSGNNIVKQSILPDGSTVTIYEDNSAIITKTDGTKTYVNNADNIVYGPSGNVSKVTGGPQEKIGEKTLPDGTKLVQYSDGSVIVTKPDGTTSNVPKADNITYDKNGNIESISGGAKVVEGKKELPDGTKVTNYKDGSAIVTKPNGTSTYVPDAKDIIYDLDGNIAKIDGEHHEQSSEKTLPDGTKVTEFDDGTAQVTKPNGTTTKADKEDIKYDKKGNITNITGGVNESEGHKKLPDGSTVTEYDDGSAIITKPNGTSTYVPNASDIEYDKKGNISKIDGESHTSTTTQTLPDGTKVTEYSDGTTKVEKPDGTTEKVPDKEDIKYDNNGNITDIGGGSSNVVDTQVLPDGTKVTEFDDGTTNIEKPDGTTTKADKEEIKYDNNGNISDITGGSSEVVDTKELPDGTTVTEYDNGKTQIEKPDGSSATTEKDKVNYDDEGNISHIDKDDTTVKEETKLPDGSTVTEYDDGTVQVTKPDGTTEITDKKESEESLPGKVDPILPTEQKPTNPTTPTNPDPSTPDNPVTPSDPTTPDNPVTPTNPTNPDNPNPGTPTEPEPSNPTTPDNPTTPTDPDTPKDPEPMTPEIYEGTEHSLVIKNKYDQDMTYVLAIEIGGNSTLPPEFVKYSLTIDGNYRTGYIGQYKWNEKNNHYKLFEGIIKAGATITADLDLGIDREKITNEYQNTYFKGTLKAYMAYKDK